MCLVVDDIGSRVMDDVLWSAFMQKVNIPSELAIGEEDSPMITTFTLIFIDYRETLQNERQTIP